MFKHIFVILLIKNIKSNLRMKKIAYTLLALIGLGLTSSAQTTNWSTDKSHSSVKFSVEHMVISETEGNFQEFNCTTSTPAADNFNGAQIAFTIQVASINTNDPKRDSHLKSADFFDAEKFSTISFKSIAMKQVEGKNYKLMGMLTMHGVTKEVTFDVVYNGMAKDPWGNVHAGFKIMGQVNRFDYDLKWNTLMEAGGAMVGEMVAFTVNLELLQEKK
jgi:polyisoprenoid-binding protein YceI